MFLADENVDRVTVERLRADGHDVLWVSEMEPGIDDARVLGIANAEKRVLITGDKDFGELVFRQGLVSSGVVLLRLAGLPNAVKASQLSAAIRDHASEMAGAFTVVSPGQVRIRSR